MSMDWLLWVIRAIIIAVGIILAIIVWKGKNLRIASFFSLVQLCRETSSNAWSKIGFAASSLIRKGSEGGSVLAQFKSIPHVGGKSSFGKCSWSSNE